MIKNDRQYGIIRGRIERLVRLADDLQSRLRESPDSARIELELRAVRAETQRLQADLDDYESLKAGQGAVGIAHRVEDLPRLLIRARVAAGLGHAELAQAIGVKPQQIQRYEATDYESASLSRLIEVAKAVGLELSPRAMDSVSRPSREWKALKTIGLDRPFAERRLGISQDDSESGVIALSLAAHMFNVRPEQLLEGDLESITESLQPVAYKKPKRSNERKAVALSGYARYLCRVILQGLPKQTGSLPNDPKHLNSIISPSGEPVTFEATVRAIWNSGIAVLPLNEGGGFHAAYWRIDEHDVITINSSSDLSSLWLFYLLHEVGHAAESPGDGVVETSPGRDEAVTPERENRANEFATESIFGGRSMQLADLAMDRVQGKLALMQRSVRWVARNNEVDQGLLALNVAHRLSSLGQDWWGAAMAMQVPSIDPWRVARDELLIRLNWDAIEPLDVELLARALDVFPDVMTSPRPR